MTTRPAGHVAAGDDAGDGPAELLLVLGDEPAHPHVPELGAEARGDAPPGRAQVGGRPRRAVVRGEREHLLLRVVHERVGAERDGVAVAQEPERPSSAAEVDTFAIAMVVKPFTMNGVTSVSYASASRMARSASLLRAAAGGEEPDARSRRAPCTSRRAATIASAWRQVSQPPPSARSCGAATTGTRAYFTAIIAFWKAWTVRATSSKAPSAMAATRSARFAPDREVRPLVRDDEALPLRLGAPDRLVEHGERVAADGVHLRVELEAEDAVAEVEHGGAGVPLHDRRPPSRAAARSTAPGGHRARRAEPPAREVEVASAGRPRRRRSDSTRRSARRHRHPVRLGARDERGDADGVEHLEGPELPVEAPAHRAVHVDHVVGDLRDPREGVEERVAQVPPGELGRAVLAGEHGRAAAAPGRRAPSPPPPRRTAASSPGTYSTVAGSRWSVSAFSPFVFLKKPCLVLLPRSPSATIRSMKAGSLNVSRRSSSGRSVVGVPRHVEQRVDADEVGGAEAGALRARRGGAGRPRPPPRR